MFRQEYLVWGIGASTPPHIPRNGNRMETIDWTSSGYIVVIDDGGAGVDIYLALKDAATGKVVVFIDQRTREFGKFQPKSRKRLSRNLLCEK